MSEGPEPLARQRPTLGVRISRRKQTYSADETLGCFRILDSPNTRPDHDGLILGERRDGKQADPGEHDRNDLTCSKEMKRDRAVGAQGSGK